jgi:cytoskeleton protein RodZ
VSRHRNRRGRSSDRDSAHHRPAEIGQARSLRDLVEELAPGAALRRARESRGSILAALEAHDTAHLPAPVYTKGFVKVYAREVGLDPERTAAAYLAQFEPAAVSPATHLPPSAAPAPHIAGITLRDDNAQMLLGTPPRRLGGVATVLCAIGLVVYVWSFNRETAVSGTEPLPQASDAEAVDAVATEQPDAVAARAAVIEPLDGPLQIELRITGDCWVVAAADGTQVLAKLLRDGERRAVTATDAVALRVGDPGALSYTINGQPGRALGARGQPVDVHITRENFREFLAAH